LEESVEETLKRIVLKITRKKNVNYSSKTRFEDLNADSLDKVQILVKLEETYDIELPDDEVRRVVDMGGFVDLIKSKIAEKAQKQGSN
jgi:acyl carrier protein